MGNCFGGNPYYGYPGNGYDQYGVAYGAGYGPGYGYGIDADPFTPGIQPMPGVVTPMGPPIISPMNGSYVGGIPPIPGYAPPMMSTMIQPPIAPMAMTSVAPMVSMAPVAPIVTQSILNPTMMGTSYAGSMYGRPGYPIDIDPITPGIQTAPGLVSATGPSYILGL